jgi:Flp pilus assembly pilin Flp
MRTKLTRLRTLAEREDGQTMAEYSIVLSIISIAVIAAMLLLAGSISDALTTVADLV